MFPKYLSDRLTFGLILFLILGVIWALLKVFGVG